MASALSAAAQVVESEPLKATQANPAVCRKRPVAMSGRRPMRSETAPAMGEMNIGVAKRGEQAYAGRDW